MRMTSQILSSQKSTIRILIVTLKLYAKTKALRVSMRTRAKEGRRYSPLSGNT